MLTEAQVREIVRDEYAAIQREERAAKRAGLLAEAREAYLAHGVRLGGTLYEPLYAELDAERK